MPAPAFEIPPSPPPSDPEPPAAGPSGASGLPGALKEVALIGGGALLVTAGVIQLLLWSESYRDISPLGQLVVVLGVLGILFALAMVRLGNLVMVVAAALYLAATTALLLLAGSLEWFGYQEGFPAPYSGRTIIVPIAGLLLLGAAAWQLAPERSSKPKSKPKPKTSAEAARAAEAEQTLEPASLVPTEPESETVERIRWPAERPRPMLAGSPAAPAPAAAAPGPAQAEAAPAPGPPVEEATPEPAAGEPEAEPAGAAGEPVAEPAGAAGEPETERIPVIEEPETEPPEPEEPADRPQPTAELDPIPDAISDPVRSMLIREQAVLERLIGALGPDDPGTLTIRGNIAAHYLAAGDAARAADLQEGVAADSERILGAKHPHTLTAQGKATQWRKLAKKRRRSKVPVAG